MNIKESFETGPYSGDIREWLNSRNFSAIADLYNAKRWDWSVTTSTVTVSQLSLWMAKNNIRSKIRSISKQDEHPLQSICLAIEDLLVGLSGPALDLRNPDVLLLLGALVQGQVLTVEQKDELLGLTTRFHASYGEVLFGADYIVTPTEIQQAFES